MTKWENNKEIQIFQEYLRIKTVHPDIDYEPCISFLKKQATYAGLPIEVYRPSSQKHPIIVITWKGRDPSLSSILLNSHMDVVPVFEDKWTHPPFGAEMDSEGRIFARGAQDMKCVGMQYLGAIRALKAAGVHCQRTIHVSFVPDEETSGVHGMLAFLKTVEFSKLNVGFCLDEGMASDTSTFRVFYAERSIWREYKIRGNSGHGSLLHLNTPGEKLCYLLNKLMEIRAQETKRLHSSENIAEGDVTTINLTMVRGGVQVNVVPSELEATFDMRLSSNQNHDEFYKKLEQIRDEAGGEIDMEFILKTNYVKPTPIDESNIFWMGFKKAVDGLGLDVKAEVFAGGTDGNLVRELGIPTLGFSPISETPGLMHDHDEFLGADVYLRGILIYKEIIEKVANATEYNKMDNPPSIPICVQTF